jgi:hypothetical protein
VPQDLDLVRQALRTDSDEGFWQLCQNEQVCFWVNHGEMDEDTVGYCEELLQTGRLSATVVETEDEPGYALFIEYGSQRVKVPLTEDVADRHITVHTLNELLAPDFEIRYLYASNGTDGAGCLPLPIAAWQSLEAEFADRLPRRFMKIAASPNVFTDVISTPIVPRQSVANEPRPAPASVRPWWRFW